MFEEAAHLVGEHLLLGLRGDAALEKHEHGIAERVALLGQIAQVVAAQDRLLPGLVGKRGLTFKKWISVHDQGSGFLLTVTIGLPRCSFEPSGSPTTLGPR